MGTMITSVETGSILAVQTIMDILDLRRTAIVEDTEMVITEMVIAMEDTVMALGEMVTAKEDTEMVIAMVDTEVVTAMEDTGMVITMEVTEIVTATEDTRLEELMEVSTMDERMVLIRREREGVFITMHIAMKSLTSVKAKFPIINCI